MGWYIRKGSQVSGPVLTSTLKQYAAMGRLIPEDQVRNGETGPWVHAESVTGLVFKCHSQTQQSSKPSGLPNVGSSESAPSATRNVMNVVFGILMIPFGIGLGIMYGEGHWVGWSWIILAGAIPYGVLHVVQGIRGKPVRPRFE